MYLEKYDIYLENILVQKYCIITFWVQKMVRLHYIKQFLSWWQYFFDCISQGVWIPNKDTFYLTNNTCNIISLIVFLIWHPRLQWNMSFMSNPGKFGWTNLNFINNIRWYMCTFNVFYISGNNKQLVIYSNTYLSPKNLFHNFTF